jgi:Tol biopolymer transport system component
LGAGGMGEVYRAMDTKLGREVALKVLPAAVAADVDRMARFTREAQVLATLNHPHIAMIYGVEDAGGTRALVMELVEGPTLADRIDAGPIPVDESIAIAREIAEALEAAHEKGIVHRDLKPANIKVTPEGKVKVLDFGLAKAMAENSMVSDPVNSPTLTIAATQAGIILGTAAYMPPEQARGKAVDRRADIWAFGVVLYEMLTGARGYSGDTAAETLAAVIKDELDWSKLPPETPAYVRRLLKRCLDKDPRKRLRDIGEARIMLEEGDKGLGEAPVSQPVAAAPPPPAPRKLPWALAGALLVTAAALAFVHFTEKPAPPRVLRYSLELPEKSAVHSFAASPDGRTVVFAAGAQGKRQLWVRSLDTLEAHALPGTDGAQYPFWSPDNRSIAFFADAKLKKISAAGGPAQSLCDAANGRSGSWNREDILLFAPSPNGGLQRVPAAGGVPVYVTKTKFDHRFPVFLPDGQHFLYVVSLDPDANGNGLFIGSLDGKLNRRLMADQSSALYLPPSAGQRLGHLLLVRDSTLMAQPFDTGRLQLAGDIFPVAEHVSFGANNNFAPITASESGLMIYQSFRTVGGTSRLLWFDRSGKQTGIAAETAEYSFVKLSPDEKTLALSRMNGSPGAANVTADLWLRDLARGTETRFTFHASENDGPVWSPRGDRIAFTSNRPGHYDLFIKAASGTGADEPLLATANNKIAYDWSRDGRFLMYAEADPKGKTDLWALPMDGPPEARKPVPFLQTEFNEIQAQFSPDGHWVAYTSDESGRREVYVRPFPAADGKWKVSTDGGEEPRWRADGKELFFLASDGRLHAVSVRAATAPKSAFELGAPEPLFEPRIDTQSGNNLGISYEVSADGKHFLVVSSNGAQSDLPLTVVANWNPAK